MQFSNPRRMFFNIHRTRYIILLCLGLQKLVAAESTFVASFQTDIEGPSFANTTSWIEFSNKMPSVKLGMLESVQFTTKIKSPKV